jgi:hypothetical protein
MLEELSKLSGDADNNISANINFAYAGGCGEAAGSEQRNFFLHPTAFVLRAIDHTAPRTILNASLLTHSKVRGLYRQSIFGLLFLATYRQFV